MLTTVQAWSEAAQAVVPWAVSLDHESDEGGNVHAVIVARHGDEVHRFSPTHTGVELQQRFDEINRRAIDALVERLGTAEAVTRLGGG